jgi:glycosyltransferase involved in cell wall biosynthesis
MVQCFRIDMHKVLFVQHAGSLGGSAMSLLYTVRGIVQAGHRAVIALVRPSEDLRRLYTDAGLEVLDWPGIRTFEHTTAFWTSFGRPDQWSTLLRTLAGWSMSQERTRQLVNHVAPTIVHLNSVVLAPAAAALRGIVPVVWHVREHPVDGHFGLRKSWQRDALLKWPSEVIFLSNAEKQAWVGGRRGVVVPNFVDLSFGTAMSRAQAREKLSVADDDEVVLYVGGPSAMKGVFVLIEAISMLARRRPRLRCLMPGTQYVPSGRAISRLARVVLPLLGTGTNAQRLEHALREAHVTDVCRSLPFNRDMPTFLAATDVLVFPAIEPHFARPIVEAGAMGLPTVASRSAITEEQVLDGETGLLTEPGDPGALAQAIETLLADPPRARTMGAAARVRARRRHGEAGGVAEIISIYDGIHPGGAV